MTNDVDPYDWPLVDYLNGYSFPEIADRRRHDMTIEDVRERAAKENWRDKRKSLLFGAYSKMEHQNEVLKEQEEQLFDLKQKYSLMMAKHIGWKARNKS